MRKKFPAYVALFQHLREQSYTHAANYLVNCKVIQTSGGAWNPWKKGKERNKKSVVRKRPL